MYHWVFFLFIEGDFAEKLPDFQMVEIMKCIIAQSPVLSLNHEERTIDSRFMIINNFVKIYIESISSDGNLKFQILLLITIQKVRLFF